MPSPRGTVLHTEDSHAQWTLPPSRGMVGWVDCQSLVNSLNNCMFKTISVDDFIRSGQEFYYSQTLLSPSWRNFQPFCKVVGCWQQILIAYFCLKQRLTHIKTKPNQNKTMIHWWSHEIRLHKGCSCLTRMDPFLQHEYHLSCANALYPACILCSSLCEWKSLSDCIEFAVVEDFLTRMLREVEGQGDVGSLPILKGDIFISFNFIAFF